MGQNLEDIRFDGELFLEDVLEKLHKKMDELKEDLTAEIGRASCRERV